MSYATVAVAIFSKTGLREHLLQVFTCEQVQNLLSFKETGQEQPEMVLYALSRSDFSHCRTHSTRALIHWPAKRQQPIQLQDMGY